MFLRVSEAIGGPDPPPESPNPPILKSLISHQADNVLVTPVAMTGEDGDPSADLPAYPYMILLCKIMLWFYILFDIVKTKNISF